MIENKLEHIQLPNGETLNIYADSTLLYQSFDTIDELFDADKLYTFGNYEVPSDAVNLPVSVNKNGFMYVIEDNKKPIQIYSNRASKDIYYRGLDETGNWSLWDRITGYNSLKSNIDNEVNRAMGEETALSSRITNEETERKNGDNALSEKLNTYSAIINNGVQDSFENCEPNTPETIYMSFCNYLADVGSGFCFVGTQDITQYGWALFISNNGLYMRKKVANSWSVWENIK